jgi:hypothetical protein
MTATSAISAMLARRPRKGPAIIETGARLMGAAMDRDSYRAAGMRTQASIYAEALAGTATDWAGTSGRRHYAFGKHLTKLLFSFGEAGHVRSIDGLERLRDLPSFHAHYRALKVGGRVWKTADTLACGGVVYLIHEDAEQIAADIGRIREWEKRGQLYDITPANEASAAELVAAGQTGGRP